MDSSVAPATESDVVEYWLTLESRKPWETLDAAAADAASATRRSTLRDLRAYQTAFFDAYDLDWTRRTLTEADLRRLRVIPGDPDTSWRRLSPDGTVLGAARRLLGRHYRGFFEDVYVDLIYLLADNPRAAAANQTLVVIDDPEAPGPFVIDGNHHATARALRLLERGRYSPLEAFVGEVRGRRSQLRDRQGAVRNRPDESRSRRRRFGISSGVRGVPGRRSRGRGSPPAGARRRRPASSGEGGPERNP